MNGTITIHHRLLTNALTAAATARETGDPELQYHSARAAAALMARLRTLGSLGVLLDPYEHSLMQNILLAGDPGIWGEVLAVLGCPEDHRWRGLDQTLREMRFFDARHRSGDGLDTDPVLRVALDVGAIHSCDLIAGELLNAALRHLAPGIVDRLIAEDRIRAPRYCADMIAPLLKLDPNRARAILERLPVGDLSRLLRRCADPRGLDLLLDVLDDPGLLHDAMPDTKVVADLLATVSAHRRITLLRSFPELARFTCGARN